MVSDPHNAVQIALEKGMLVKPSICSKFNNESNNIEAHHNDYNKPLEVEWLCRKCHNELHKVFKAKGKNPRVDKQCYLYPDEKLKERIQKSAEKLGISVSSWLILAAQEKLRKEERK